METNEKIRNSKILNIVILLIIIIGIIGIIGIAYARYITSEKGTGEAQVAKWSFNVVDGDTSTIDVLDFPITRTDENIDVDRSTIGPGTYGKFEIDIDARGTETILTYEIKIRFANKPKNLKFYSNEKMTEEIELDAEGKLVIFKFLSLENLNDIQQNMIYWSWPLETGTTDEEIVKNDLLDSQFIGKKLAMVITITGTQVHEILPNEIVAATTTNGETHYYSSLQEAITSAGTDNATVTLMKSGAANITVSENQNIILNLNGKTLNALDLETRNQIIRNYGNITIQGRGIINGKNTSSINNYGTMMIKDITITNENKNGVYCEWAAQLTIDGTIIDVAGTALDIWADPASKVEICSGNIISSSTAIEIGGAGKVTINGGTIESKNSITIKNNKDGIIEINGGIITQQNRSSTIYNQGDGSVTINGGNIEKSSDPNTFAIKNGKGSVNINGGTIINSNGKAISNELSSGKIKITGGVIEGTYGIYNSNGFVEINDGNIVGVTDSGVCVVDGNCIFNGGTIKGKTNSIDGAVLIKDGYHRVDTTNSDGYKITYLESD